MKKDKIIAELEKQVTEELEKIALMESDSDERAAALENLQKLNQVLNEYKAGKMNKPWEPYVKLILNGVEVVLPLVLFGGFVKAGFEFEKTGTFTSKTFMKLFSLLHF